MSPLYKKKNRSKKSTRVDRRPERTRIPHTSVLGRNKLPEVVAKMIHCDLSPTRHGYMDEVHSGETAEKQKVHVLTQQPSLSFEKDCHL